MDIDLEQLKQLMRTLREHDIDELEYENAEERLVLRRNAGSTFVTSAPQSTHAQHAPASSPLPPAPATAAAAAADPNVAYIVSPFVGTFYAAPSPNAPNFVDVGASIRAGQTLCIVEAMKLMNEIESEMSGTIVEVLVASGKPVEYGEKLFRVRKG
jgi:acetyl-CoA carboxylase biotin carboxyl carrier protein